MFKYILLYLGTFAVFLIVDFVWLTVISKDFYQKEIGTLLLKTPNLLPALIFYLLFVFAIIVLIVLPGLNSGSLLKTLAYAFLFGVITYATYDLTNLATLKDWSLKVTVIDIFWGGFLATITSYFSYYLGDKIL